MTDVKNFLDKVWNGVSELPPQGYLMDTLRKATELTRKSRKEEEFYAKIKRRL
jgi:hypothetical protein